VSATNRGAERAERDHYPTPEWCVDAIMAELDTERPGIKWGEPCRGGGVIYDHLPGDPEWAELSMGRDYLEQTMEADAIVTNPPFSLASPFLEKSLGEAGLVVYLLRLNYLGSQQRKAFWNRNPVTHLFPLSQRPAFVAVCKGDKKAGLKACGQQYPLGTRGTCSCGGAIGDGTDATEYAWFVWDRLGLCYRAPGIYVI
jgi:hypothetical protein